MKQFFSTHKNALIAIFGNGIGFFSTTLLLTSLPIIFTKYYGSSTAGMILGALTAMQFLLIEPLTGNIADTFGARSTIRLGWFLVFLATILWFIFGGTALAFIILAIFRYIGMCFRSVEIYLLKTTSPDEGGTIFGIKDTMIALSKVISIMSVPVFLQLQNFTYMIGAATFCSCIAFLLTFCFKNEIAVQKKHSTPFSWSIFNPIKNVFHGLHFIKKNKGYPILLVGYSVFEGIFFGSISFLFPLYIASLGDGPLSSLPFSVYPITTLIFAGLFGYLADHYHWKILGLSGWVGIIGGLISLFFAQSVIALIASGAIIGISVNLIISATRHAIEAHDHDHKEDGAFEMFQTQVADIFNSLSPVIMGICYAIYGFFTVLSGVIVVALCIAVIMLIVTASMGNKHFKYPFLHFRRAQNRY